MSDLVVRCVFGLPFPSQAARLQDVINVPFQASQANIQSLGVRTYCVLLRYDRILSYSKLIFLSGCPSIILLACVYMMAPSRRSFVSLSWAALARCPLPSFCLFFWALFNLFPNAHALSPSPVDVTPPQNAHSAISAVVVQDNFLGISFELNSFDTLCACFCVETF